MNRVYRYFWKTISLTFYRNKFKEFGRGSIIYSPMEIVNHNSINIGDGVSIFNGAWLIGAKNTSSLKIGNGVTIGHFSHIVANYGVEIENDVLIADKVFITDCTHEYKNIEIPIIKQKVSCINGVAIGKGSWIGENVCILGASIGKHCVIGANSVVIKDIPDYAVAAGNPAEIIKKYDFKKKEWVSVRGRENEKNTE